MQVQKKGPLAQYKGSVDCMRQIFTKYGVNGLYKGFLITVYREFVLYGSYFAVYEFIKSKFESPSKL